MDDITRKHLEGLEQRLDAKIDGMEAKLDGVEARVRGKLEAVATSLEATMSAAIAAGFRGASEERRLLHGETMRKFQHVIDEAERLGAMAARDRRVGELETEVTELRERLARVELALQARD